MNEIRFQLVSNKALEKIFNIAIKLDDLDIEFDGNIIEITSKDGIFIINKHNAAKEIWLSSPISGPFHFIYNEINDKWISKNGEELYKILSLELNLKI